MAQGDLFTEPDDDFDVERPTTSPRDRSVPLAERLRPQTFDDLLGQEAVFGQGSLLRDLIEKDAVPSMILWGPPGTGKTTAARLIAQKTKRPFTAFSAVFSGVKEVREVIAAARRRRKSDGKTTIFFVDEIHRFNKSQQDAFLPDIEDGTITLIGATTENPSFELNQALLSRCQVFVLAAHTRESLAAIAQRALADPERYDLPPGVGIGEDGLAVLVATSAGDARTLLARLDAILERERKRPGPLPRLLDAAAVRAALNDRTLRYDKSGETHFNVMSAFHKSMRGGDPQASLYWLARMLEGGEDPLWVVRRIVRFASEDIGLADPAALQIALAAKDSYDFLGRPEGLLALAQAAVYCATAPKSNAVYKAYGAVKAEIDRGAVHDVPPWLRNAPTKLMKDLGYGSDYKYPHDFDHAVADQDYLPPEMRGRAWYRPSPFGHEKEIGRRIEYWEKLKRELGDRKP